MWKSPPQTCLDWKGINLWTVTLADQIYYKDIRPRSLRSKTRESFLSRYQLLGFSPFSFLGLRVWEDQDDPARINIISTCAFLFFFPEDFSLSSLLLKWKFELWFSHVLCFILTRIKLTWTNYIKTRDIIEKKRVLFSKPGKIFFLPLSPFWSNCLPTCTSSILEKKYLTEQDFLLNPVFHLHKSDKP